MVKDENKCDKDLKNVQVGSMYYISAEHKCVLVQFN